MSFAPRTVVLGPFCFVVPIGGTPGAPGSPMSLVLPDLAQVFTAAIVGEGFGGNVVGVSVALIGPLPPPGVLITLDIGGTQFPISPMAQASGMTTLGVVGALAVGTLLQVYCAAAAGDADGCGVTAWVTVEGTP